MDKRTEIINGIIAGGGIYGYTAAKAAHEPSDADRIIEHCFDQCHTQLAHEIWGSELIVEIIQYRLHLLRTAFEELFIFGIV